LSARKVRTMRKSASVLMPSSARRVMLPPSPPSPPSGPPNGTNFSRRKLTHPRPPFPACTLRVASSTNFIAAPQTKTPATPGFFASQSAGMSLLGDDVHESVARLATYLERDASLGLREQGVIRADPDIHARMPLSAALADENVAGQHFLAAELL